MLDGAARIGDLVEEVARQEMPAIAMTDHGNVFGAFDFYKQAVKAGVKPIIGIEAYVAPESRFDKKKVQWADGGDDDVGARILALESERQQFLHKNIEFGKRIGEYQAIGASYFCHINGI